MNVLSISHNIVAIGRDVIAMSGFQEDTSERVNLQIILVEARHAL